MSTERTNAGRSVIVAISILALFLLASDQVEGQRYQQRQLVLSEDPQSGGEPQVDGGERVDKLASASGDQYYQRPQLLADWYRQLAMSRPEVREAESNQYQLIGMDGTQKMQQPLTLDPYSWDYRALVNEFKRQSPMANPSRESRAFKPRLMSTARGFGKRAGQRHITYADLLAAANPASGLMASNGKMSSDAISSKYSEWVNQVMSRWPTMDKYVNAKFIDYNG